MAIRPTPGRSLVAAPTSLGLWVPARSNARVIYGHPFETINADVQKAQLEAFYAGLVEGPHHVLELRDGTERIARARILGMRREVPDRVIAPVIAKSALAMPH